MPAALAHRLLTHRAAKPLLWVLLLLPLAWLVAAAMLNTLGPNPAEALTRQTGLWALRLLAATLAVTPLRRLSGWPALLRFRRMLGLASFGYASLHLLAWAWLDQGLQPAALLQDMAKRPFILVGALTWLALLPLALTSTNAMVRRLGGRRWQALHRVVYAVALSALLHFFWMKAAKADFLEWGVYAAVFALLLGWRLRAWWRARRRA